MPVEIPPLRPSDMMNGFKINKDNINAGINKMAATLKFIKYLNCLEQLGHTLTLPDLFKFLENRLIFLSQCGHFNVNPPY